MIVVKVELWSAITGEKTELARMHISNRGDHPDPRKGNYLGETFIGRSTAALDRGTISKQATLENFPRLQLHIWNMVNRMLTAMGYNK